MLFIPEHAFIEERIQNNINKIVYINKNQFVKDLIIMA